MRNNTLHHIFSCTTLSPQIIHFICHQQRFMSEWRVLCPGASLTTTGITESTFSRPTRMGRRKPMTTICMRAAKKKSSGTYYYCALLSYYCVPYTTIQLFTNFLTPPTRSFQALRRDYRVTILVVSYSRIAASIRLPTFLPNTIFDDEATKHTLKIRPLSHDLMKREGVGHGDNGEEQTNNYFQSLQHKLYSFYRPTAEETNTYRKIQGNGRKRTSIIHSNVG